MLLLYFRKHSLNYVDYYDDEYSEIAYVDDGEEEDDMEASANVLLEEFIKDSDIKTDSKDKTDFSQKNSSHINYDYHPIISFFEEF